MAIQFRRGNKSGWDLNNADIVAGEPVVALDTEQLFVGTGDGEYFEVAGMDDVPLASSDTPEMDGVAAVGVSDDYARADHVHPSDTSKADADNVYTKAEMDTSLNLKADKSDTYTKATVDAIVQDAIAEAVKEAEYSNFEMKSVSGDFVHITDGAGLIPVKDLKIGIEAVQDLHGYDAPWVGGAGVNQWDEEWEVYGGTQIKSKNRIKVIPNEKYYIVCPSASSIFYYADLSGSTIGNASLNAGGGELTIPSGANYLNIFTAPAYGTTYNHDIAVNYPSTVTTYSPYANICPIIGWTGAEVSVAGGNLFNSATASANSRVSTANGGVQSNQNMHASDFIPVFPNSQYTLNFQYYSSGNFGLAFYDESKTFVSGIKQGEGSSTNPFTFTVPTNAYYIRFSSEDAVISVDDITFIRGTEPSVVKDYVEPTVYPISWQDEAGTVYGGTLDVTTGELVVDKVAVAMGTIGFAYLSSYTVFTGELPTAILPPLNSDHIPLSSEYKGRTPYYVTGLLNGEIMYNSSGNAGVFIKDERYTDATAFRNALTESNAQLVYELKTPQTYQLTPTEVLTLLGENNIFADTGAIEELIYRISHQNA